MLKTDCSCVVYIYSRNSTHGNLPILTFKTTHALLTLFYNNVALKSLKYLHNYTVIQNFFFQGIKFIGVRQTAVIETS